MNAADKPSRGPGYSRRLGLMLAGGAVVVILVVVTLVLILAGGNKTKDGTGRDSQSTQQTIISHPNDQGSRAGGPVR